MFTSTVSAVITCGDGWPCPSKNTSHLLLGDSEPCTVEILDASETPGSSQDRDTCTPTDLAPSNVLYTVQGYPPLSIYSSAFVYTPGDSLY